MICPGDEAEDIDRNPEEDCCCHRYEAVCAKYAYNDLAGFDAERDDKVPAALLGYQKLAEYVKDRIGKIKCHDKSAVDAVDILFGKEDGAYNRKHEDADEPDLLISCKICV